MKKPTKIICNDCLNVIYSKYYGHHASCKCGKTGIDETAYYCRILGSNYSEVEVEERSSSESDNGSSSE